MNSSNYLRENGYDTVNYSTTVNSYIPSVTDKECPDCGLLKMNDSCPVSFSECLLTNEKYMLYHKSAINNF